MQCLDYPFVSNSINVLSKTYVAHATFKDAYTEGRPQLSAVCI